MEPKKFKEKYSGGLSKRFWKVVNSLPEKEKQEMYFAGVLLQNMEELVLKILNEYIDEFQT